MRQIYNKSALEKLSSPDQLDRMIIITSPRLWIFLLAVAVVLAVSLIWAIKGSVPVNLDADGVYMNTGGTDILYAQNTGLVSKITVKTGTQVKKGDTLAYIRVVDEAEEADRLKERIEELKKISFDGQGDLATNDNSQLLEIKRNIITLGSGVETNRASLALKRKMRDDAYQDAANKKAEMDERQNAYYTSVKSTGQTPNIEYSQAQSKFSLATSTASGLNNLYLQAQSAYETALAAYKSQYVGSDGKVINDYSDVPGTANYNAEFAAAKAQVKAASVAVDAYKSEYSTAQSSSKDAENRLNAIKGIYEGQQDYEASRASFNTVSYSEYTRALSAYTNAEAKYQNLVSEVNVLEMQLGLEEDNLSAQTQTLRVQFDNTKGSLINQLEDQRKKYLEKMEKAVVQATADGVLYELSMAEGGAVQQGGRVGSILVGNTQMNTVVCYVPLQNAKKLSPGMTVRAYPTIVNRQEYGYMAGKVCEIGQYPASSEEILSDVGGEALVNEFQKMGPVIAVRCELEKDENTASGYKWSTKKGEDVVIPPCTLMSVSIETEKKAPVDIIIPYIKEKLSFDKRF